MLLADDGSTLREIGEYIGISTNNVAEWNALLVGLRAALDLGIDNLDVRLDSELVVRQLTGAYRVKHPNLIPLYRKVRGLMERFARVEVQHVRRAQNAVADALVNRVLDEAIAHERGRSPEKRKS